jgi:parvulin-like peptidyl-prolyl isomerase
MRARLIRSLLAAPLAVFALVFAVPSRPQEVIDRIAARVENDIILLSEVRELGRYQQFLDGKSETEEQLLDRLIDQWIVRTEAEASRFPQPSEEDINHGVERVQQSFASPEKFASRKKQCGLNDVEVRRMVASQLYLSNYLDSRFRPSAQIDAKAIEDFYQNALVPQAKARGQAPPTLDDARDLIHEALVQQNITEQADRWLKESRARLHIEKFLVAGQI